MKRWACAMVSIGIWVRVQSYIGWRRKLYSFGLIPIQICAVTYIRSLLRVRIKVADEWQISLGYVRGSNIYVRGYLDLLAWSLNLHAQTEENLYGKALFLHENDAFPSADKRNTHDKAKGLCISSERYIGELSVRCLSPLSRGQDSKSTVSICKSY